MSIKSFLQSVLNFVKDFIKNILPSSKHLLDIALAIVNGIKSVDTSAPMLLDTIVSLIPGTVDDAILAKIRKGLPKWIATITFLDQQAGKTPDELLKEGIEKIKAMKDSGAYSDVLQSLFKQIGFAVTDASISYSDLQKISQAYYEMYGAKTVPSCPAGEYYDSTLKKCMPIT